MTRLVPLLAALVPLAPVALAAEAGDASLGVGAALSWDMPDPASKDGARFGPGPSLQIPFRYRLAPLARLRITGRVDLATGTDRVRWTQDVDGEPVEFESSGHFAMLLAAALSAGADFLLPVKGKAVPYLGAEVGGAWVGTYHSLSGATQVLLDPDQNDLDSPRNIDPYTSQLTFLTDVHLGVDVAAADKLAVWVETGYSVAFLNARELEKAPPELDATRDAYGWNALRLGAGVQFFF